MVSISEGVLVTPFVILKNENMNLDYLPKASEGHMTPLESTLDLWTSLQSDTGYKHLFEIGLNAGHSTAMNLTLFPYVKVTSIDIGRHQYTQVAADILREKFSPRFDYHQIDSQSYYKQSLIGNGRHSDDIDAVFIDGGHTFQDVINDFALSRLIGAIDIFVDDTDGGAVEFACQCLETLGTIIKIKDYQYQSWSENKNDPRYYDNQVTHYRFT